ncbi:CaiB/BaiF CoA-transferase family protein [Streptomyces sp. NPDC047117]|uniref:CaiB/BaiF CoA transferase family protein n=1 Tax=Streptomyces sp. NPDC047117 TaxID=3155379 RepID=UPI00340208E9
MPPSPDGTAPLSGVRVVEIGAYMAAPFAAMQLADLGAEVIKVESPGTGDPTRANGPFVGSESSPFLRLNRNKRSVTVDLKAPEGAELLRDLAGTADVLVENLRPGAMRRLGLGYEDLRATCPRLVYVSASGWGQDGPLAHLPGLDIMAQARSGIMSITGEPDSGPVKAGVPVCDLVCGLYGALAAVSALRARDVTGEGQYIDVSLLESAVSLTIWEAGRYFATGEAGQRLGSAHQTNAPYQAVRSRDGWVTVGAITPRTWKDFATALGLEELLDDARYATTTDRHAHRDTLIPAIEAVTATLDSAEIVGRLDAAGVPCAPISTTDQVFTDRHLAERDFLWDAGHPLLGPVRQLGSPMRFSATPTRRDTAGPVLGADTAGVLADLGYPAERISALMAAGVVHGPDHGHNDGQERGDG